VTDRACIYSFPDDRHVANGSCAHIIPSAIGGRRTSTTIACGHHNNLTNTCIEKPFIEHFTFFNSMLSIVPGRSGTMASLRGGRPPTTYENGHVVDQAVIAMTLLVS